MSADDDTITAHQARQHRWQPKEDVETTMSTKSNGPTAGGGRAGKDKQEAYANITPASGAKPSEGARPAGGHTTRSDLQQLGATALDGALAWADAGYPVFPCHPETKKPLTEHGFHDATTDHQKIKAWWRQYPDALIGVPCGLASGFVVLDLDTHHEPSGFEAVPDWESLSPTRVRTATGGVHLYFAAGETPIRNSEGNLPSVDTRGEGGYVIVPPSKRESGAYVWESGGMDTLRALPPFPESIRAKNLA